MTRAHGEHASRGARPPGEGQGPERHAENDIVERRHGDHHADAGEADRQRLLGEARHGEERGDKDEALRIAEGGGEAGEEGPPRRQHGRRGARGFRRRCEVAADQPEAHPGEVEPAGDLHRHGGGGKELEQPEQAEEPGEPPQERAEDDGGRHGDDGRGRRGQSHRHEQDHVRAGSQDGDEPEAGENEKGVGGRHDSGWSVIV